MKLKYREKLPKTIKIDLDLIWDEEGEILFFSNCKTFYKVWVGSQEYVENFPIEEHTARSYNNDLDSWSFFKRDVWSALYIDKRYREKAKVFAVKISENITAVVLKMNKRLCLIQKHFEYNKAKDILIQTLLLIYEMRRKYNIVHNDLYLRNILLKPTTKTEFSSIFKGYNVKVSTHGYKVTFIDFEFVSQGDHIHKVIHHGLEKTTYDDAHAIWVCDYDTRDVYAVIDSVNFFTNKGVKRLLRKLFNILLEEETIEAVLTHLLPPLMNCDKITDGC